MNLHYLLLRLLRHFMPEGLARFLLKRRWIIKPGLESPDPFAASQRYVETLSAQGASIQGRRVLVFGYGGRFAVGVDLLKRGAAHVESARDKLEKVQEEIIGNVANDKKDISIRTGGALKTLRISAAPQAEAAKEEAEQPSSFRAPRRNDISAADLFEAESEPVLMLTPSNKKPFRRKTGAVVLHAAGLLLTAMWVGLCASYIMTDVGWSTVASQQPHLLCGFIAGVLAPVALLWVILAFVQRGSNIHMYAESLRGELQALTPAAKRGAQLFMGKPAAPAATPAAC